MNHPFRIEGSDQHGFDFRFLQAHFSWWWVFWASPNCTVSLCKWFVLKTPCCITSHDFFLKFGSVSADKTMSWACEPRECFWSSFKLCGKNRAQTFCSFKSSFNMWCTSHLLIPVTSSMSLMNLQQSFLISSRFFPTDSSVRLDACRPCAHCHPAILCLS